MANFYLPKDSDIALAARGWPGPNSPPYERYQYTPNVIGAFRFGIGKGGSLTNEVSGVNAVAEQDISFGGVTALSGNGYKYAFIENNVANDSSGEKINLFQNGPDYSALPDFTVYIRFRSDDEGNDYPYLMSRRDVSTNFGVLECKPSRFLVNFGGSSIVTSGIAAGSDNQIVAFSHAHSGEKITRAVLNGTYLEASAGSTTGFPGQNGGWYLGNMGPGARGWRGLVYECYVFDRALNESELKDFAKNPYKYIFEPANDTTYLITVPDAGGAPTLSAATATSIGQTTATVGCTVTF